MDDFNLLTSEAYKILVAKFSLDELHNWFLWPILNSSMLLLLIHYDNTAKNQPPGGDHKG